MLQQQQQNDNAFADNFFAIEQKLSSDLEALDLVGNHVRYVYNPISYARETHLAFLRRYMNAEKKVLFLGMNPGPWGMAQSGVPFGQVDIVRDWLDISGPVEKPSREHPKRPVEGFACTRKEVSGERMWSLFREICGEPEKFFETCAVYNHCPLAFLAESGKNVTPEDAKLERRNDILKLCDDALLVVLKLLRVEMVVGVGRFAQKRAQRVVIDGQLDIRVGFLHHPSPASAAANRGWSQIAKKQLMELGVLDLLQPIDA